MNTFLKNLGLILVALGAIILVVCFFTGNVNENGFLIIFKEITYPHKMKTKLRHSIAFIFSLASLISYATGLEGDVIYIDEHKWQLLAKPLLYDSLMCAKLEKHLPQGRSVSTANWEGYTAYWVLHENTLYLHHIKVPMHKDSTIYFTLDTLKSIFPTYATEYGIEAYWYNEKTRAAKGEEISDVDTGCQWYTAENMEDPEIAPNLYD